MDANSKILNSFVCDSINYCNILVEKLRQITLQIRGINDRLKAGDFIDRNDFLYLEEDARITKKRIDENIATIRYHSNLIVFDDNDFANISNTVLRYALYSSSSIESQILSDHIFLGGTLLEGLTVTFRNSGYETWTENKVALKVKIYNDQLNARSQKATLLPLNTSVATGESLTINANPMIIPSEKGVYRVRLSIISNVSEDVEANEFGLSTRGVYSEKRYGITADYEYGYYDTDGMDVI